MIFFTGFPGFIGRRLISRIIEKNADARITCLVQEKFLSQAEEDVRQLTRSHDLPDGRIELQKGDITAPHLGMDESAYSRITEELTEVWHLAAVYDLAVPAELARRVNIDGTENVLDLCRESKGLRRHVYYSTCYVSGLRCGLVLGSELEKGQDFKNHYESTKYEAEIRVRKSIAEGIPAIVIRPGVVVGDSKTGETDKFDGPYFALTFLDRVIRPIPLLPPAYIGPMKIDLNFVPVDYLVDATVEIAANPKAVGGTFQIADPNPLGARAIYRLMCEAVCGRKPLISIPAGLVDWLLRFGWVRRWFGVPREVAVYFNHDVRYDTTDTEQILQETGVRCPRFDEYFPVLFRYWKANRHRTGMHAKV